MADILRKVYVQIILLLGVIITDYAYSVAVEQLRLHRTTWKVNHKVHLILDYS